MSNSIRIEPLEPDELTFIQKRCVFESKAYMFGMNMFLLATVAIPFGVALAYYLKFERVDVMLKAFFYALCITTVLFSVISFFSYKRSLSDIKKDAKEKTKIIEASLITEKKFMQQNNSYHFYLNSDIKYTIEVNESDFQRFETGDEINIEYARYSREYFGYF